MAEKTEQYARTVEDKTDAELQTCISAENVLKFLILRRGNFSRTAKDLGLSRYELMKWLETHPEVKAEGEKRVNNRLAEIVEKAVDNISDALDRGNLKVSLAVLQRAKLIEQIDPVVSKQLPGSGAKTAPNPGDKTKALPSAESQWKEYHKELPTTKDGQIIISEEQH